MTFTMLAVLIIGLSWGISLHHPHKIHDEYHYYRDPEYKKINTKTKEELIKEYQEDLILKSKIQVRDASKRSFF